MFQAFESFCERKGIRLTHDQKCVASLILNSASGQRMFSSLGTGKTFLLKLLETFAAER